MTSHNPAPEPEDVDPAEVIEESVISVESHAAPAELVADRQLDAVPPERLEEWSQRLTEAIRRLSRLRRRLERARQPHETDRCCPVCGESLYGRPDRRYCSSACRQVAYRRRKPRSRS